MIVLFYVNFFGFIRSVVLQANLGILCNLHMDIHESVLNQYSPYMYVLPYSFDCVILWKCFMQNRNKKGI